MPGVAALRRHALHARPVLRRFWRWWITELRATFTAVVKRAWPAALHKLEAEMKEEEITLRETRGNAPPTEVRLRFDPKSGLVSASDPGAKFKGRRISVFLQQNQALVRSLRFPTATIPYLRNAVALQLDRLTPLNRELIEFDVRVAGEPPSSPGVASVELAIVRKADLETAEGIIQRLNLRPTQFLVRSPTTNATFSFPRASQPRKGKTGLSATALHLKIAAALTGALAIAAVHRWYSDGGELKSAVENARERAKVAEELYSKVQARAVVAQKVQSDLPSTGFVTILAELGRLLPEDCWLQELTSSDAEIRIVGLARDSSQIVSRLQSSSLFQRVLLQSTFVEPNEGKERFEIFLRLKSVAQ